MKSKPVSYTALGLILSGTAGVVMFALTGEVWWLGLIGLGLVLGAGMDGTKQTH